MPTTVSNPRDLLVLLLGQLLFVERRLADGVLADLIAHVRDPELQQVLRRHTEATRAHAERLEMAFRRLELAPTSNISLAFESAVAQHAQLRGSVMEPRLADLFHAQAALQTEHWEIAGYRAALSLCPEPVRELLRPSLGEDNEAAKELVASIDRLGASAPSGE